MQREIYSKLLEELELLQHEHELITLEQSKTTEINLCNPLHLESAANLILYLGLRRCDMRPLQEKLAAVGLSSLGRAESLVDSNINSVINLLRCALGLQQIENIAPEAYEAGIKLLLRNTENLLGKPPAHRHVRIMVTLPGEIAEDYKQIKDMLTQGMDCARINCAHDNPEIWRRMIAQIKQARRETGKSCRILMDLGGPKLRTGEISTEPAVLKWRPHRNQFGKVITPARIWLHAEKDEGTSPAPADACLPVCSDWLEQISTHDLIEFTDARGALRILQVMNQVSSGFWAECTQTSYVIPGIELKLLRTSTSGRHRPFAKLGRVGALPASPESIRLHVLDSLIITREPLPGKAAQFDAQGRLLRSASIACTLPEVFRTVQPGERILIDDGRIGGVIRSVSKNKMIVEITQTKEGGEKLLAGKGINLPDSHLELDGLTAQDIDHLEFVVKHADMVGLSFVRNPADIEPLQKHLLKLKAEKLGIILKIETRAAFDNLPGLLLTLLRSPTIGVMISRGDLAVECGFERLAELQEEILWLAEAVHLPVICATQVLEGLSKNSKPSRAEITDAAMGVRTECVMLNKGAYIIEAMETLDDILHRMQSHQQKRTLLRRLHW